MASVTTHRSNAPYISKYIESCIRGIPECDNREANEKKFPSVLIVGPTHYLNRIYPDINNYFSNVKYKASQSAKNIKIDGYRLILKNIESNLGWRLIIESDLVPKDIRKIIFAQGGICNNMDENFKVQHLIRLENLSKLKNNVSITKEEVADIKNYFEVDVDEVLKEIYGINSEVSLGQVADDDLEQSRNDLSPLIQLATFNGCKGLSAGHVFVVGFEAGVFPKGRVPTDNEVSQLIVAMTRTRKQCHLIYAKNIFGKVCDPSIFLEWISAESKSYVTVNKDTFSSKPA